MATTDTKKKPTAKKVQPVKSTTPVAPKAQTNASPTTGQANANTSLLFAPKATAPNNDIEQIFKGIKQNRGMIRRDLSGNIMNDTASGSSLDNFLAKNPQLASSAQQGSVPQAYSQLFGQRQNAGSAAVDFAKQTKGYTDASGRFVPPTIPSEPRSNYGTGSVSFGPRTGPATTIDPLTGQKVPLNQYLGDLKATQATKGIDPITGGPMTAEAQQLAQENFFNPKQADPNGMDQLFGNKSSSPGGNFAGPVAPAPLMGTPGGDVVQADVLGFPQLPPNAGPQQQLGPNAGPQRQLPPNAGPQTQLGMGPPRPIATPEQKAALEKLNSVSNLGFRLGDFYPGNDYNYLNTLFPGTATPNLRTPNDLIEAYRKLNKLYQ